MENGATSSAMYSQPSMQRHVAASLYEQERAESYQDSEPDSFAAPFNPTHSHLDMEEAYRRAAGKQKASRFKGSKVASGSKNLSKWLSGLFAGEDPEIGRARQYREELLDKAHHEKTVADPNLADDPTWSYPAPPFNAPGSGASMREGVIPTKFTRRTKLNLWGLFVNVLYYVVLGFYSWVRVTKTMDLGPYTWYAVLVFVVEVMGATTTIIYGLNHIWMPVHEKIPDDPESGKLPGQPMLPLVHLQYNIRVLIPCYKEDFDIIKATIEGARRAQLPRGCTRTIYLCDDGKDKKKLKWCKDSAQAKDVVYVSGRKREEGEINGKSGNLNNCLSQIYAVNDYREIPSNEVVAVFDADQVANDNFFTRMLPLFDAGEDVAMVLSPQHFHNVQAGDIFNHGNTHFWEYMQVGYDALGFISCTGTNFLIRARAFCHAGWSPTYTMTEDYALGMELKKRGWHCRFVNEVLVIGEAPDQLRNCYQQRSRWAKGHFQMFFQWSHCPLSQKGLSPFMRVLYCSGVWSYIVTFTTIPLFILLPIITVWIGIFPIQINWWAWVGITAYVLSSQLVMGYVRKSAHVQALFYADISNRILWFTYLKAFWRGMGAALTGKKIAFKATAKGAAKLVDSVWTDLTVPFICFVALAVTFAIGIRDLNRAPTLRTTLVISIVWMIYNIIPSYLVIHYTWIGKRASLTLMCRLGMFLSWICGIAGLVLLWWLIPQDFHLSEMIGGTVSFFTAVRADLPAVAGGRSLLQSINTPALPAFHADAVSSADAFGYAFGPQLRGGRRLRQDEDELVFGDASKFTVSRAPPTPPSPPPAPPAINNLENREIKGGWMTGAEAGYLRMTMPTAFTTSLLSWGMQSFLPGYEQTGMTDKMLEQIKVGTDFLLRCIRNDPAPRFKWIPPPPPPPRRPASCWADPKAPASPAVPIPGLVAAVPNGHTASQAVPPAGVYSLWGGAVEVSLMGASPPLYSNPTTYPSPLCRSAPSAGGAWALKPKPFTDVSHGGSHGSSPHAGGGVHDPFSLFSHFPLFSEAPGGNGAGEGAGPLRKGGSASAGVQVGGYQLFGGSGFGSAGQGSYPMTLLPALF